MPIFTIIGSIIGAGFASGQEIYLFFFRYGKSGIYGLIICSLLMSYIIYYVLKIIHEKDIETYEEFLDVIFKKNSGEKEYFNLSYINNIIVNIFLLITFFIMVAGFGAYFNQEFGLNSFIGSSIISILSFFVFMTNVRGLTKVNGITVPFLILIIVFIGIKNISNIDILKINYKVESNINKWIFYSIIYCSYNIILLIPVLVNLKCYVKNKKSIFTIAIFSGCIFVLLAICIFFLLINIDIPFDNLDMPTIYAIKRYFPEFRVTFGLVILISIFSTAVSLGMSFLKNICNNKKSYPYIAIGMCISGLIFSIFGFSNLVKILFPCFGILGLVQIWKIVISL